MKLSLLPVVVGLVLLAGCASNLKRISAVHVPEGSTDTTNHAIEARVRQTLSLQQGTIRIDNAFSGGGFATAADAGDGIEIVIKPENSPINDSAWFAFRLAATQPEAKREVTLTLKYVGGTHRYDPKVSTDGKSWQPLPPNALTVAQDKTQATFKVTVTAAPLWVSAQELVTAEDVDQWVTSLGRHPFVTTTVIGRSAAGRSMPSFSVTEGTGVKKVLIVLGRQHPPEATGTMALMSFVETLCGDAEIAKRFRQKYETVVMPMINPDGVDAGHWRHNLHGVDLNRDWEFFRQEETRVVRDALLKLQGRPVAFAVDFHSTFKDVFYVLQETVPVSSKTLSDDWIKAIAKRLPSYVYRVQAVTTNVPAASIWLNKTFGIPTVTYEVGDETPRPELREISQIAASELMQLLLAQ